MRAAKAGQRDAWQERTAARDGTGTAACRKHEATGPARPGRARAGQQRAGLKTADTPEHRKQQKYAAVRDGPRHRSPPQTPSDTTGQTT